MSDTKDKGLAPTPEPAQKKEDSAPHASNKVTQGAEKINQWWTYYPNEKNSGRVFVEYDPASVGKIKTRYQSYPDLFSHPYKAGGPEPIRKADLKIDFDDDVTIELTVNEARKVIDFCSTQYGVHPTAWRIWLSGGRGVHLQLSAAYFGLENGATKLPIYYRKFMQAVQMELDLKTVDTSIYNMKSGKLFRRANVERENGKYKVPITLLELKKKPYAELVSLIDKPRQINLNKTAHTPSARLLKKMKAIRQEVKEDAQRATGRTQADILDRLSSVNEPGCIEVMINDNSPAEPGRRDFNKITMSLIRWFKAKGMTKEEAVERCQPLLDNYAHSSSHNTPELRKANFESRWDSMDASDEFRCGYVQSLGIQAIPDRCKNCYVTHLPLHQETVRVKEGFFKSAYDLAQRPAPINWLINDTLEAGAMTIVYGPSDVYKSFCVIGMGLSIAHGLPWQARPAKQGPVFYICGEGHRGVGKRVRAWHAHQGLDVPEDLPFYTSKAEVRLFDAESAEAVAQLIDEMTIESGAPRLVIVDTFSRNFGGNENSNQDTATFFNSITKLGGPACTKVVVHHTGHDGNKTRGASNFLGDYDARYKMDRVGKEGSSVYFKCEKQKDAERAATMNLDKRVIYLGEDMETEEKLSSVVLVRTEVEALSEAVTGQEVADGRQHLTATENLYYESLVAAVADNDGDPVSKKEWREAYNGHHNQDATRQTADKHQRRIADKGYVEISGEKRSTSCRAVGFEEWKERMECDDIL